MCVCVLQKYLHLSAVFNRSVNEKLIFSVERFSLDDKVSLVNILNTKLQFV